MRRNSAMTDLLVLFLIEGQRYALPLSAVDRIVRVVEITALPQAPDSVLGIVNVQGRVVPVIDLRRRLGLPGKAGSLSEQMIITRTPRRVVMLIVDAVETVIDAPERSIVAAGDMLPDLPHIEGVVKLDDGLVLIEDLDRLLSLEEEHALDHALAEA